MRLLTLTGPGRTGKTRLALQAASEAAESFPDGITWLTSAITRFGPDAAHPGQALRVREETGQQLAETLATALAGNRMLIVLNAEHLLPGVARTLIALRMIDGPVFLVTSCERLFLQGEHLHPVPQMHGHDGIDLFAFALSPSTREGREDADEHSGLQACPARTTLVLTARCRQCVGPPPRSGGSPGTSASRLTRCGPRPTAGPAGAPSLGIPVPSRLGQGIAACRRRQRM